MSMVVLKSYRPSLLLCWLQVHGSEGFKNGESKESKDASLVSFFLKICVNSDSLTPISL